MITIQSLKKNVTKKKQRVGRGNGSNRGKNSGLGHKGQVKRGHVRIGFEGGQKPLIRRLPKFRGFKQLDRKDTAALALDTILKLKFEGEITIQGLIESGLLKKHIKKLRVLKPKSEIDSSKNFLFEDQIYLTKGAKEYIK